MHLTLSNHSFEYLNLEGTLGLAKAIGFRGVDIAGFHNRGRCSLEPDAVGADPQEYADQLKNILDKYELKAFDFFPQFGSSLDERSFNDPNPKIRDKNLTSLTGIITFCKCVGIPGFTISPGIHHPNKSFEENLETTIESMVNLINVGRDQEVTVRFEPHVQSVVDTPERALLLLQATPGSMVTLDYSHFIMQYIPEERIHPLLAYTDHFHIRSARPGKLQSRLDENTIDFIDIADRLDRLAYKGCLSLEYVYMDWYDCNQIDCLTETILTKDYMQKHKSVFL